VQANRISYNAKQAFAYAALNGNQQKPPDVHAAVDAPIRLPTTCSMAATCAHGEHRWQITATVKSPGSPQPQVLISHRISSGNI